MSTLDECRKCGLIYQVSGFYPGWDGVSLQWSPEFNRWDDCRDTALNLYWRYKELLPGEALGYWCEECLAQGLRDAIHHKYGVWIRSNFWLSLWSDFKGKWWGRDYCGDLHAKMTLKFWLWDMRREFFPETLPPVKVETITWPWEKRKIHCR